jgi:hypothetical protein
MRTPVQTVLIFAFSIGFCSAAFATQSVLPDSPAATGELWAACNAAGKVLSVGLSIITSVVGMVLGWCIFPMTLAPLAYLTQSELAIWGSRLSMAIVAGAVGFIFPFILLVKFFGS